MNKFSQTEEEKLNWIYAADDSKVGFKKPFIVGVEGQEGEEVEGEEMEGKEVKKYFRDMYITYDENTKIITLEGHGDTFNVNIDDVWFEPIRKGYSIIHLPDGYHMPTRYSSPRFLPDKVAPTKSVNNSVTKATRSTKPNRSKKSITKIFSKMSLVGGTKYKKSMKNKRKTKKHKSRRYRKIK